MSVAVVSASANRGISTKPIASQQSFSMKLACGLVGVLLAVLIAGINENVTKVAMPDIRGALFIGYDEASWLTALYSAFSVTAMAFTPWFANTFSIRLFGLWAVFAFVLLGLVCPFAPNLAVLTLIRSLQGLAGGTLPPLLMTCALRFLPPHIKIYGLACFALTATFGPSVGTPIAAVCMEQLGWMWACWIMIPVGILSLWGISYGLPQDPIKLERFKQFDGVGLLLGFPAITMLCIGILQGERLDWFNSPFISQLILMGSLLLVLFFINEWFHPLPFFKIQLLRIRNLSFSLVTLGAVVFVLVSIISIPSGFLLKIQGYRPVQSAPIFVISALPQLIALPLVAACCNLKRVDCRLVLATGLAMMAYSCYLGSLLTQDWINSNFYVIAALQIVAQPMIVIPILMLATGQIKPMDGPFASAWFNTIKGFAGVCAAGGVDFLNRMRERFHEFSLLDQVANHHSLEESLSLIKRIKVQATILGYSDMYLLLGAIAFVLMVITLIAPTRIFPPSVVSSS